MLLLGFPQPRPITSIVGMRFAFPTYSGCHDNEHSRYKNNDGRKASTETGR
jgi:hypothetical protein